MKRMLSALPLLLALAAAMPAVAEVQGGDLPDLGDGAGLSITPDQEYKLGRLFMRQLRGQAQSLSDPVVQDYLERLSYRLAFHSPLQHPDLSLVILRDTSINAFAVPGGVIGVNVGLLLHADTEAELASVLAHELGHLSQRHYIRRVAESKQSAWMNLAGFLATIAIASSGNSEGAFAAAMTTQAAAIDRSLAYSRQFEQEADRIGMQTLADAGMDPHAMPQFFTLMDKQSRIAGSIPEFVLTHPLTASRIADTYNRAAKYPEKLAMDSLDYQLVRMRFLVHFLPDNNGGVAQFQRQLAGLEPDSDRARINRFGLALAYLRDRQPDKAREALAPLLAGPNPRIDYVIAAAEIEMAQRKYAEAARLLKPALALNPGNYPLLMYYARAQISDGHPEEVIGNLEAMSREREDDPYVWRLLVDAYTGSKNPLGVYRARAESYFLNGDDQRAMEQLRNAADSVKDNYPLYAKIQKRMREMQQVKDEAKRL
ncbi:MAG TPA: M48 family metalloprotease [Terriglobales bacterium]|nr:M48 family metalloprotease [Terriglobales bacterium]